MALIRRLKGDGIHFIRRRFGIVNILVAEDYYRRQLNAGLTE
jgi:hypothetical protein